MGTPNYRPWIMHPWSLCVYAIVPLVMLGITEYLLQTSVWHVHLFSNHGQKQLLFREILAQFFGLSVVLLVGLFLYDLDQAVKKMEPFYQLSKPHGANGWDSLCVDYFRCLIYFTPILAFRHKHWAVLCSSSAAIISTNALSTLALGIFTTDNNEDTVMDVVSTRIFESCLGLLSLVIGILAILIWRRNSGLERFPDGFDTLVNFTSCRHLEKSLYNLFKERTTDHMSEKELNAVIGPLRFRLQRRAPGARAFNIVMYDYTEPATQAWHRTTWNSCKQWRIITQGPSTSTKQNRQNPQGQLWKPWSVCSAGLAIAWEWSKLTFRWISRPILAAPKILCNKCGCLKNRLQKFRSRWLWKDNHPTLLQTVPISGITVLLLTLFVIANGQPFWASSSGFFRFIGEERLARSMVSTTVNVFIWTQIDKHAKLMEPMYLLLRPQGAPYNIVNGDYLGLWPFQDIYYCITNCKNTPNKKISDYVMAFVILGTYASNLFGLFWNMLNLNDGSFGSGFYAILSMMVACEFVMLAALGIVIGYRRQPILPRQPVTLASIISFIYRIDIVPPTDTPVTLHPALPNQSEKIAMRVGDQENPTGADIAIGGSRSESLSGFSTLNSPAEDTIAATHPLPPTVATETGVATGPGPPGDVSKPHSLSDVSTLNSSGAEDITGTHSHFPLPIPRAVETADVSTSPNISGDAAGWSRCSVAAGGLRLCQFPSSCSTSHTLLDITPSCKLSDILLPSSSTGNEKLGNSNRSLIQAQTQCWCPEVSAEDIEERQNVPCAFGWLERDDQGKHLGIWRWDSGIRPYTFGVENPSLV